MTCRVSDIQYSDALLDVRQAAENLQAAEAEVDLIGHQNEQMFRYVRSPLCADSQP